MAAAFLPAGAQISSPPLSLIRSRRVDRNTSVRLSSSRSYRRLARPETHIPVSMRIWISAVSRRSLEGGAGARLQKAGQFGVIQERLRLLGDLGPVDTLHWVGR